MRKTPNSYNFHLPSLRMPAELQFSPVYSEDDELIQDIDADRRENMWQLDAAVDPDALQQFWDNVSIDE